MGDLESEPMDKKKTDSKGKSIPKTTIITRGRGSFMRIVDTGLEDSSVPAPVITEHSGTKPQVAKPKKGDSPQTKPAESTSVKTESQSPKISITKPSDTKKSSKKPSATKKSGTTAASKPSLSVSPSFGERNISFNKPLPIFQKLTAHGFLSIDIDTNKIRYVAGHATSKNLAINKRGSLFLPENDGDKQKSIRLLLDNIKANVHKSGQKIHACIYSPDVTIRPLFLPKMRKSKELNNAVFYKLQSDLTGFDEKSVWRYKIIDEVVRDDVKYYKIIILVIPDDVINGYLSLFDAAGLSPDTLTVRPVALNCAYNKLVFKNGADVLVDISYALTHINFINNGALEYTRTISSGASNFEVAIRGKEGKLLENESFKLKGEDGISKSGALRPELLRKTLGMRLTALEAHQNPVLRLFKNELQHSLEYFNSIEKNVEVKRIFLSGYGIQKESLVSFLKNNLKLPVFLLTPKIEDSNFLEQGEYLTPIGTNIDSDDIFNLVPKSHRINVLFKRLNFAAVIVAVLIGLGLYNYNHVMDLTITALKSQVQYLAQQYKQLNPIEAEYTRDQEMVKKNNLEIADLEKNILAGSPIVSLMKLFSNETPDQIVITSINLIRSNPVQLKNDHSSQIEPNKITRAFSIRVSGEVNGDYLMSDVILINYMDRLRGLGYFKSIEVSDKTKKSGQQKMIFEFKAILED